MKGSARHTIPCRRTAADEGYIGRILVAVANEVPEQLNGHHFVNQRIVEVLRQRKHSHALVFFIDMGHVFFFCNAKAEVV